jgi:16S rRNA (cytosine1402-N4)-methyltransferase
MKNGMFEGEPERDFSEIFSVPLNWETIVPSDEEIKINNRARSAKLKLGREKNRFL